MSLASRAPGLVLAVAAAASLTATGSPVVPHVQVTRVPDAGVQPEMTVDAAGVVHLIYLAGDPKAADVYYTSSTDGGETFAPAVRVNSQSGSAVAVGTIRGAQLALGPDGRVHVVWNGPTGATPPPPAPAGQAPGMPLLYARSTPDRRAFEPQRGLMTTTWHLDGGASVAADERGVYVAWHGHALDADDGEQARRVFLARSTDAGATFAPERAVSPEATGACGCCGLRAAAGPTGLHILYRGARALVHRDIHALRSTDGGATFSTALRDAWEVGTCPMSSISILPDAPALYAWEHDGTVAFAEAGSPTVVRPTGVPGSAGPRRAHPRLARDAGGIVLLAWATGTGWNRGGDVAWQTFADGRPLGPMVTRNGLPVWSAPAVAAVRGGFLVLY